MNKKKALILFLIISATLNMYLSYNLSDAKETEKIIETTMFSRADKAIDDASNNISN